MIGRKGQGAMEYLMTYGWAILVVMVVGIVMWQLGIFNMGSATLTSTGFAKIKPQLAATGVNRDGTPIMVFTNGVGTNIRLTGGVITFDGVATTCALTEGNFLSGTGDNNVPAGGNFRISRASCAGVSGSPGDVYNAQVSLGYVVSIGGIETSHTESGNIRGPFE
jgi:hypothetical protein